MASLLGNLGVATQFVDAPGHIFLLFDTGLRDRYRDALGVDTSLTVVLDGEVWAPLETTALAKGFVQAWHIGADEIGSWTLRDQIHYWDVTEALTHYEPVLPPGERHLAVLDTLEFGRRLTAETRAYAEMRDAYFTAHYGGSGRDLEISAEALVEIAHADFVGGDLDGALTQLASALQKAPHSMVAHNDFGVVLAALGRMPEAEEQWFTAAAVGGNEAGVWLNLGIAQCAGGDSLAGHESLARGVAAAGGFAPACALLALSPADAGVRGSETAGGPPTNEVWLRAQLRAAVAPAAVPAARAGSARRHAPSPAGHGMGAPTTGPGLLPVEGFRHLCWIE
jgi:hypothetical protein